MYFIKKYRFFIVSLTITLTLTIVNQVQGMKAIEITMYSFREMLLIIPPIFILLGLLDVWVPRETMVKYMGDHAGIAGPLIAFILGSAAAGPLYGAFPVAAVLMKKGASYNNIMIFIGAWSTTKIPLLIFEATSLGLPFMLTRLLINIPGILLIALLINKVLSSDEKDTIYRLSSKLST